MNRPSPHPSSSRSETPARRLRGRATGVHALVLLLFVANVPPQRADAAAEDFGAIAGVARRDLDAALKRLSDIRADIEQQKISLGREVSSLEQQVLDRRSEVQRAERFQENALVELNALKAQAQARGDEAKFIDSLLAEYERAFRTRLHIGEEARFKPLLDAVDRGAMAIDATPAERIASRLRLLQISLDHQHALVGGDTFEGQALAPDGRIVSGGIALMGPIGLFAGTNVPVVGLLQQALNKADPAVVALPGDLNDGVRALATRGEGVLALDPTLGNAVKLASLRESLGAHIVKGGITMVPILGLAAIALFIAGLKWFQLSRLRLATPADLQLVLSRLEGGEMDRALAHARGIPGPAGELLATAVEHADEKKEYLEEVLYEKMLASKPKLEAFLPFIALTAAAAPLLGLLGTVTGMITTFNMISIFGTGDPRTLSSGISEALITTEYGLYVAIPAVLAHAFLSRKAKGVLGSMEQTAVGFINGVPDRAPALAPP